MAILRRSINVLPCSACEAVNRKWEVASKYFKTIENNKRKKMKIFTVSRSDNRPDTQLDLFEPL
jgi:hypothetical protein